jgi:hypothetical protein
MPLRSAGSAARRRRVPLGVLGPALVWRIVWLPWVAVGVAVPPEPRRWVCWWGGIVVGVPVVWCGGVRGCTGILRFQCVVNVVVCPFDGDCSGRRRTRVLERARRDGRAKLSE